MTNPAELIKTKIERYKKILNQKFYKALRENKKRGRPKPPPDLLNSILDEINSLIRYGADKYNYWKNQRSYTMRFEDVLNHIEYTFLEISLMLFYLPLINIDNGWSYWQLHAKASEEMMNEYPYPNWPKLDFYNYSQLAL